MEEISDKKRLGLKISLRTYRAFNKAVLEKYGTTHGHLGKSVEEALVLWIKLEKEKVIEK